MAKTVRIHDQTLIPFRMLVDANNPESILIREINRLANSVRVSTTPGDLTRHGYMVRLEVFVDVERKDDDE